MTKDDRVETVLQQANGLLAGDVNDTGALLDALESLSTELQELREALGEAHDAVAEVRWFLMQTIHPLGMSDRMDEIQLRLAALSHQGKQP